MDKKMDKHFLKSYVELLIQTCHKRGIHAMGGMAAQIPIRSDAAKNEIALEKVRQDKLREAKAGLEQATARALAYAPYTDLLWFETSKSDLSQTKTFADAIHKKYPEKLLAYNCSPSFNWKLNLDEPTIAKFQQSIGAMGYKFQFVTLSGFHVLNHSMFTLANEYKDKGMAAYSKLQSGEFESEKIGYEATKHQDFVDTGYFDAVTEISSQGQSSTLGMHGSTEKEQFKK